MLIILMFLQLIKVAFSPTFIKSTSTKSIRTWSLIQTLLIDQILSYSIWTIIPFELFDGCVADLCQLNFIIIIKLL